MTHLDKFLQIDSENIEKSKNTLTTIFPESLELIESYINYFKNVLTEFGKESDYNSHQALIAKWAKNIRVSDVEILQYLRSAVLIGESEDTDLTEDAQDSLNHAQTIIVRMILCMRLQRDFLFGFSDLLKCRVSPAIGYIRLQAETAGIMKIMTTNNLMANDWLLSMSSSSKQFYNNWHSKIKVSINDLNLSQDYNFGSGFSLHSRVGGVSKGTLLGFKNKDPKELVLIFQEIESPEDLFFWFGYYIRFHKKIIDNMEILVPELRKKKKYDSNYNYLEYHTNKAWSIAQNFRKK